MTETHLSELRFSDFDIPETVLKGIAQTGFEFCTPIQAQTIPELLAGHDIAGQAQTGTGKTAAFLIATISTLVKQPASEQRRNNQPRALVLVPTRELAIQIAKDAEPLNADAKLNICLAYGGVDYDKQRKNIEAGVDILIGTPGRLIDYFKQKVFDLRELQVLVLDEADRMFDLGFIKDLRFLLRRCSPPEQRLSMLFSATLSYRVMELAYEHLNDPQKIEVQAEQVTADRVDQTVFYPSNDEKIPLLIGLLEAEKPTRSIVFSNTKHAADKVVRWLSGNDYSVILLSGDVPQKKRERLLQEFIEGKHSVLVATDVAARGLHVPDISHVFNYDLPQSSEDYVHRIGRTARAGASGRALSFACEDTSFYLPDIEEYVGTKLPMGQVMDFIKTDLKPPTKAERKRPPSNDKSHSDRSRRRHKPASGDSNKQKSEGSSTVKPAGSADEKAAAPKKRRRRKPRDNSNSSGPSASPPTTESSS